MHEGTRIHHHTIVSNVLEHTSESIFSLTWKKAFVVTIRTSSTCKTAILKLLACGCFVEFVVLGTRGGFGDGKYRLVLSKNCTHGA